MKTMHNLRSSKPVSGRARARANSSFGRSTRLAAGTAGLATVAGAVTVAGFATSALASGIATAHFGGEHGTPTTDNPTAIYYNPAGLADRDPDAKSTPFEFHFYADADLAWHTQSWTHALSKSDSPIPQGAEGGNTGEAKLLNFVAAPMAGVNFKIGDFAVGAGFFVPFGGQASWSKNQKFANSKTFAGPYDGVQRWQVIDGEIKSVYVSVGAAYDIAKRVSIGAAFNLVNSDVKQNRARVTDGSNDIGIEGRSYLDVSSWNAAFGLGVLGEIVPRKLWLGVSYQSQPGVVGNMVLKGTLQNNFAGAKSKDPVKLFQEMPAVYRFGVRARPVDKVELRFSADLIDWSVFKNQCITTDKATDCTVNKDGSATKGENPVPLQNIVRDWGPAFGARISASYWIKEEIELFGGFGYDSNAVPSSTLEPALVDFHDFSPAIGAHFAIGKHFGTEISYTQFIYVPRDTTGLSQTANYQSPSKTPDSGGKYTQALGVTQVAIDVGF